MADTVPSSPPPNVPTGGRRRSAKQSAWMSHVMATKRAHKGKPLSVILRMASKTFKKSRRGGAVTLTPASVESAVVQSGGRGKKTRRNRRK